MPPTRSPSFILARARAILPALREGGPGIAALLRTAWIARRHGNRVDVTCVVGAGTEVTHSILHPHARIEPRADVRQTVLGAHSSIGRASKVTHAHIGPFTTVGPDVTLNATEHPVDRLTTNAFPYSASVGLFVPKSLDLNHPLRVGPDAWIGANAVVQVGCDVGAGAVVEPGSVVTRPVPPYAIVGGVPARVQRSRFEEAIVQRLLRLAWWELPDPVLIAHHHLFEGPIDEARLQALEALRREHDGGPQAGAGLRGR